MRYESKKDQTIIAKLLSEDEKFKTVMLEFLTGPETGKTFSISSATLKRWWRKLKDEETVDDVSKILNINYDIVNTPYPEPTHQEYIPKPQSVIEYEENKLKRRNYNSELPTQDDMVETFSEYLSKINKTYIVFKSGSWLERKSGYINLYATEDVWLMLSEKGFECRKNGMKNTKLSVVFKIETLEQYELVSKILINTINTKEEK